MKQLSAAVGIAAVAASLLLLAAWAPATPRYKIDQFANRPRSAIDMDALTAALLEYGRRRERYDRDTFPTDMPRTGEPYDWITGNAIRR